MTQLSSASRCRAIYSNWPHRTRDLNKPFPDAACVNLLQDAIEIFFLAAFDALNIPIGKKAEFSHYLDKLSEHLSYDLPYRHRLLELNKVRVLSKHDGVTPNRDGYISAARHFLEDACARTTGTDFWTVSLRDLLDENETKQLIKNAETYFENGEFANSLVECRKAFLWNLKHNTTLKKTYERSSQYLAVKPPILRVTKISLLRM